MVAKKFSRTWKSSVSPSKQRKYAKNAPLHIKNKFTSAHLSQDLKKKYNKRNISLRVGDKVKVLRGQFKGKTGKVNRIDLKLSNVYVEGIDLVKKDGNKTFYPINPSNLMITELVVDDKMRIKTRNNMKTETKPKTKKTGGKNNG